MTGPDRTTAKPLDVFACPLDGIQLIEASAGTGKTWNICGLYLRLLLERGLPVAQILVVTFTNAATAELRERIRSRIVEAHDRLRGRPANADHFVDTLLQTLRRTHGMRDEDMKQRLDLAQQTFDEASIFTIHGFCQRALGDTPFTAGMPMALDLLTDDRELRLEVVHDFWRRRVAGAALPDALASHLLDRKDSPQAFERLLTRQLAKPLSLLRWPTGIDASEPAASAAPFDGAALAAAHAAARRLWQEERETILGCVTDALPRLNGNSYKASSVATAAQSWDATLAGDDPLAAPAGLPKLELFTKDKLKPNKGMAPPEPHPFFEQAQTLLALRESAGARLALSRSRLLRELLTEGPPALRRIKRERRVIAFDDMLYNLHERLGSGECPWLAGALRARFPAALIDEFQDTDPLQFAIFSTIYGNGAGPLFLVGDPKQAIYSFRNADLPTYLQARGQAGAEYTLAHNQRSTQGLLDALNALFSRNVHAFMLPGLGYQPVDLGAKPRKPFDDRSAPRTALQLWTLPRDEAGEPLPKAQARQAVLHACAGEIARLLGAAQRGQTLLDGRPLAAGDIAVLVRSHAQGSAMRRALAALGVGSVELSQASVYQSADAEELERVLAAILEPARERLLRAALSTGLLGLDACAIEALSGDEADLLAALTRFAVYRDEWLQRGVGVMLRRLIVHEAVAERLLARPDGERRLTNLLHLTECLHEAAETHASPEALLRWLQAQRLRDGRGDDAAQLRLESDRNLVQIITIHRAKGLEFPIVFCPFLWDGHPGRMPAGVEGREYHDAQGRPVIDLRIGAEAAADEPAIKAQIRLEAAAENLRLVYVALTRAVHRCYLPIGPYLKATRGGGSSSESCRALIHWLAAGAGQSPTEWFEHKLKPDDIESAWRTLAAPLPHAISVEALPREAVPALQMPGPAPETLAARTMPAPLPKGWWIGSYSSLAHGARHEGAAVDHDLRATTASLAAEPVAAVRIADDDILAFPRGAAAGECLHTVFEQIDFDDPARWPAAIEFALRTRPPGGPQGEPQSGIAPAWPKMIRRMLGDVLHTPLPGAAALATVTREARLTELEFSLPSGHLGAARLAAMLQAQGYPVPALSFGTLEGYLRGFIDLVFEHDGRFHILDWKSNHLGDTAAHYGPAPMQAAMDEHAYHLQALLYAVALHRHLQRRLAGYRYEQHFGGVFYLFVRGVRPGWVNADGSPAGVHAQRPSLAVIEQLSGLLAPMREAS